MDSEMDEGAPHLLGVGQPGLVPTTDDFQKVSVLYTSINPNDRELANHLVHYLRNHPRSYQIAVQMYTSYLDTSHPPMYEWTKFFCLQIINDFIVSNYSRISLEEINYIKTFMNSWLRSEVKNPSSSLIKHKMAVLFSTFFLNEFPLTWPTYFEDLLQSCNLGREAVDNFLRVLIYVCDEIGERDTSSKDEIHKRNTALKDAMREGNTLQLIITKIQNILMCCCPATRNEVCLDVEITKQALAVVEKYVNWIDIDLVANNEMFGSIINVLNYKEVNNHAIDCIHEIIYKGMLPSNKFHTIQVISNALLFNDRYCNGPLKCNEEDEEYESRIGRLLNTIGLELIKIINRIAPETSIDGQCVLTTLHKYVEIMINILACEFDDVSITVTEFAKFYLHVLKAKSNKPYGADPMCTNVELYFVKTLLEVVVIKMRYDESYNFINDGELEADFQEFRKLLNVIFENITAFNKMLVLELIEQYVNRTILLWQADKSIPFYDIEVTCHLIYLLGESLPVEKGHTHFTSPSVGNKMIRIMNAVLASDLSSHPHYAVCLYFFEVVCRFDKFFKIENGAERLKNVITAFLMERGLRHPNEKIRSRLAFLFSRFVRTLKEEISVYSREVLILMEPLVSNSNGMITNPYLSHDDQLYVYETICFLVLNLPSSGGAPEKANHFKNLLAPIRHQVEIYRTALMTEPHEPKRQLLIEEISHRIAIAGRCSKSFTCRKNMQDEGVLAIFVELMMLFISLVEDFSFEKHDIDAAVRQYLHRMVIYLEPEMLPITPRIFFAFAKVPNPAVINEFMPLLTQMVIRFKRNLYDPLLTFHGNLFGTLGKALGTEINGISNSSEDQDLMRDKLLLRRSYYQLVTAMLNSNLGDLFLLEDVFKFFVKDILYVINRESDPLLKKSVLFILRKTMELWNNENYHEIVFSTIVPPFFASLSNGLLFHSTESNYSSAADEATQFIVFLYRRNPNRMEEKLRTELLAGRPQSDIDRFVLFLESHPKCDFKLFRQFLKLKAMSAVGVQMCNGISEMPVSGSNSLKTVCHCCPYGYHIDLDFVRFCEKMAKNNGEPSIGKRQRRERRRQRQSMEVLLGLANPVIWKIEQLLPPIAQESSPHEPRVPVDMSNFTYDNEGLKKAVLDFEATLERTSKKKGNYTDSDSLERCRPDRIIPKTNEYCKTNTSPQNTYMDFDLMTCSNGSSSGASPLQNIREQMAISLERMRELEDKVKTMPTLEYELLTIKKENSFLESRLEDLKKKLRTAENNLDNLRKVEKETEIALSRRPITIDTGVSCSAIMRDVGTAPVAKKFKDVGIETEKEVRLALNLDNLRSTATPMTRSMKIQAQPQIEYKSTSTDLFMKEIEEMLENKKSNRLSLKDLNSFSLGKQPEKVTRGVQTVTKEAVNLQVIEKREVGVQVFEHKQTREIGITTKPKCFDVSLDVRPRTRDLGVSYDKISDVLCDRCKNLKTRTVGIGEGDVRTTDGSADASSLPERSKSFHFTNTANQKLTRNIAVGTVAPIRKLTSTKNVDTQDFSASRIKHIGMNTNSMKLVDSCVGSDSDLITPDTFICSKCNNEAKTSPRHVNKEKESQHKELQPSKIPRPKSLNTTPIMERKKFVRQDTYTKSLVGDSPTSEAPKKSKQRVNLSSDKSEPLAEEKVEVIRRNKTKTKEQTGVESEQLQKDLKELELEEGTDCYSRQFDDYTYDYDENYGDQDSKRNSQLFPENVLFQPIQDEQREKIKPSKEMKAAMKVVNDSLNKYPGGLPRHLKNASNIIQQEWFKISSTASANPLDVEDYLDSFEEVSSTLLEYVVNMVDNNGNTAMHYAISHGNFDVVSILLDSKVCNINKPNAAGYTCIMLVSLAQVRSETHRQVIRRLFQLADVNIRAKQHGQTALMLAVSHGRLDMVKLLLEAGADPNIQDGDGSTALMCAAEHGHTEIVKHILAHPDCDPSIVDCDGSTALAIAMEAGNRDIGVLLYAREHFASGSRGSSPYTSIRQRRGKSSSSPHCRTPTSPNPNRKSDHSL